MKPVFLSCSCSCDVLHKAYCGKNTFKDLYINWLSINAIQWMAISCGLPVESHHYFVVHYIMKLNELSLDSLFKISQIETKENMRHKGWLLSTLQNEAFDGLTDIVVPSWRNQRLWMNQLNKWFTESLMKHTTFWLLL